MVLRIYGLLMGQICRTLYVEIPTLLPIIMIAEKNETGFYEVKNSKNYFRWESKNWGKTLKIENVDDLQQFK